MTHNARALVLHHIFVWSLLGTFSLSYGTESEKHEWVFEISFKCGFEVGFLVFAISYIFIIHLVSVFVSNLMKSIKHNKGRSQGIPNT